MKIKQNRKNAGLAVLGLCLASQAFAAKVTSIDFKSTESGSEISITSDAPITFDKQENGGDKQIVLDLKDSTLSKPASRQMDTSSFDSKVLLISPYQVGGGSADSRVVIQLRDMTSANVTQDGNVLKISIPNASTAGTGTPPSTTDATDMPPANPQTNVSSDIPPPPASPAVEDAANTGNLQPTAKPSVSPDDMTQVGSTTTPPSATAEQAKAVGIKDKLSEFIENRETRRFTGKPITLKVRDADLLDVFRLIGDTSGFNIVVGDDVKGKITLSLEDVPWDQALDVILRNQKLGAERNNNLLRIVTLADLTSEKQAELAARNATEASAPRVTRVFPISFAKLDDLSVILNKFAGNVVAPAVATIPGAPGVITAPTPASTSGSMVQADNRTNSIIVRDTADNIARMQKLIELLDTQTPQVLIEAKVIEATENFSNQMGGQLGFGKGTGSGQYFGSFAGANPVDPLFSVAGSTSIFSSGGQAGASSGPPPGGTFALSPQLAFLPGNVRLNALLNLSEGESNIRIISSPKAVVLDKEKANIIESTPVLVPQVTQTANGPVSTPTIAQANLSLDVTPTVTNEGSVLMQLSVSRDVPSNVGSGTSAGQAVASRNITTKVLVQSGATLVMGGIYTLDTEADSSGFPLLRQIPILGMLFGTQTNTRDRTELFFFITPRILNLKESGVSG